MLLQIVQTLPNNQHSVNTLSWMLQAVDQLTTTGIPALLPLGVMWGRVAAMSAVCVFSVKTMINALMQRGGMAIPDFIELVARIAFSATLLLHYTTPMPGFGFSTISLFTSIGDQISGVIHLVILDQLLKDINSCSLGLQHPPAWDFVGLFYYFFVLIAMSVIDGILLIITSLGFIMVGIGTLLGPIFIPFLMFRATSAKFWGWVNFMITYGIGYRVVAAAFVFIFATLLDRFFQYSIHGDYTVAHFGALFVFMISMVFAMVWGMFKVPHVAVELFGGLGHAGAEAGASAMNFIRLTLIKKTV